jgi:hypothetical protein
MINRCYFRRDVRPKEFARMYASMRVMESCALASDCGLDRGGVGMSDADVEDGLVAGRPRARDWRW